MGLGSFISSIFGGGGTTVQQTSTQHQDITFNPVIDIATEFNPDIDIDIDTSPIAEVLDGFDSYFENQNVAIQTLNERLEPQAVLAQIELARYYEENQERSKTEVNRAELQQRAEKILKAALLIYGISKLARAAR